MVIINTNAVEVSIQAVSPELILSVPINVGSVGPAGAAASAAAGAAESAAGGGAAACAAEAAEAGGASHPSGGKWDGKKTRTTKRSRFSDPNYLPFIIGSVLLP